MSITSILSPLVGGYALRGVNQTRFFAAGNDFNGKTQRRFGTGQKWAMFLATRKVLVATTRTFSGWNPRRRSPNFAKHSKACS